jgi:hypothetical protein
MALPFKLENFDIESSQKKECIGENIIIRMSYFYDNISRVLSLKIAELAQPPSGLKCPFH